MKKVKSIASLLTVLALASVLGACKGTTTVEALPDFVKIMTESGPYFGQRRNEEDILRSRDSRIVIRRGSNANQLVFEETYRLVDRDITVRYNVDLDLANAGRNAVAFTIRQQSLQGGQTGEAIGGVAFEPNPLNPLNKYHGTFEAFTVDRVPLRTKRLQFRVSTGLQGSNPTRFFILLPPCNEGQRWDPAVAIPPAVTKCVPE